MGKQSFKTFLSEGNKLVKIASALGKTGTARHFGVMSAWTGDHTPAQNKERQRSLKILVKHLGHSFVNAEGVYKGSGEDSIMIHPKEGQSSEDFKKDLVALGTTYGQESVLHYDGKPDNVGRIIATKPNAQWGDKAYSVGDTMHTFTDVSFKPGAEDFKTETKPGLKSRLHSRSAYTLL